MQTHTHTHTHKAAHHMASPLLQGLGVGVVGEGGCLIEPQRALQVVSRWRGQHADVSASNGSDSSGSPDVMKSTLPQWRIPQHQQGPNPPPTPTLYTFIYPSIIVFLHSFNFFWSC